MKPLVEISGLTKTFYTKSEETTAIKGLTMEVYEGEFVAIVGPSGCGKSTLLSVMAGLIEPSSGECKFRDEKTSIGYMLQRDHLFSWRNILKNALLGLEVRKELTAENIEYVKSLLCTYGLEDFMYSYPGQLSGGMRQRAALIRTLAIRPDILLLDEPFSALDYQTRINVGDDIAKIIQIEKKTAVLVTHDLNEAISFADRVVVISRRPGTVKNVYEIHLESESRNRLARQNAPGFNETLQQIWEDIDTNE